MRIWSQIHKDFICEEKLAVQISETGKIFIKAYFKG